MASGVIAVSLWAYDFRLMTIPFAWWAWILCFFIDDLAYYAFHRSAHRVRWFWASHVNHHSSQHYNLSTALRQTWTGFFAISFIFRVPLLFLGFHPAMVAFIGAVNLIYQFWIHTEAIDRLGAAENILNTPSHHRVHHGVQQEYLDKNYGGILIIWDRLFGTFQREGERVRYGLTKNIDTFNPLRIASHEYADIARDVDKSQLEGNCGLAIGRMSVCPSTCSAQSISFSRVSSSV